LECRRRFVRWCDFAGWVGQGSCSRRSDLRRLSPLAVRLPARPRRVRPGTSLPARLLRGRLGQKVSHSVSAPASGSRLSSEPLLIVRLPCGTSPQHPTSLDRVFPSFCNSQAKSLSCVLEARLRWSMKGPSAVTGHNGSKKCRNWTSDSAQFCKRGPAEAAGRMSYGQTRWRFSALVVW